MLNGLKKNFRFYYLPLAGVFAAAMIFIAGVTHLSPRDSRWDVPTQQYISTQSSTPADKIQGPINLTGIWESDNPKARFVATVAGGSIDIDLQTDTGSVAYWSGNFDFPTQPIAKIQSFPDPKKLTWSNATSKEFTYLDGTIAFDYEGMGIKAGIVLHKKG